MMDYRNNPYLNYRPMFSPQQILLAQLLAQQGAASLPNRQTSALEEAMKKAGQKAGKKVLEKGAKKVGASAAGAMGLNEALAGTWVGDLLGITGSTAGSVAPTATVMPSIAGPSMQLPGLSAMAPASPAAPAAGVGAASAGATAASAGAPAQLFGPGAGGAALGAAAVAAVPTIIGPGIEKLGKKLGVFDKYEMTPKTDQEMKDSPWLQNQIEGFGGMSSERQNQVMQKANEMGLLQSTFKEDSDRRSAQFNPTNLIDPKYISDITKAAGLERSLGNTYDIQGLGSGVNGIGGISSFELEERLNPMNRRPGLIGGNGSRPSYDNVVVQKQYEKIKEFNDYLRQQGGGMSEPTPLPRPISKPQGSEPSMDALMGQTGGFEDFMKQLQGMTGPSGMPNFVAL